MRLQSPMRYLVTLLALIASTNALKFKLPGATEGHTHCVSQYVGSEILVAGFVDIGPGSNQKIDLTITEKQDPANQYFSKVNIKGSVKFTFTTHHHTDMVFCFKNTLDKVHSFIKYNCLLL